MAFDLQTTLFQGTSGAIMQGVVFGGILLLFLGLLGGLFYLWKIKTRYDIKVRIYSKRYGTWKTWDEEGAILKNKKTGEAYGFKLKHEKDLLEPPPYAIMLPSLKGSNVLHLLQLSPGEWFYLETRLDDPMGDDKLKKFHLRVIEGDIQLWMTTMIDKIYALYKKESIWDKLIPILIWALPMMFIMIILYLLFQKFDVLSTVSSNLADAANALREFKSSGAMISTG